MESCSEFHSVSVPTILVIEDEGYMQRLVSSALQRNGYRVLVAETGMDGLHQFHQQPIDLILLDILLPDIDGWEVCRRIRERRNLPIIFLTAFKEDEAEVRGLDMGAVDYITKPFKTEVLLARVRAALRRDRSTHPSSPLQYDDGNLTIDLTVKKVTVNGVLIHLTTTEFYILEYLFSNAGRVCTFQQILEHVWGPQYQDAITNVHTYISRLRYKLEPDARHPAYIMNVYGEGYLFRKRDVPGDG